MSLMLPLLFIFLWNINVHHHANPSSFAFSAIFPFEHWLKLLWSFPHPICVFDCMTFLLRVFSVRPRFSHFHWHWPLPVFIVTRQCYLSFPFVITILHYQSSLPFLITNCHSPLPFVIGWNRDSKSSLATSVPRSTMAKAVINWNGKYAQLFTIAAGTL